MSQYMPGIESKTENQNLGGYLGDVSFYLSGSNSNGNIKALKTENKSMSKSEFPICIWTI